VKLFPKLMSYDEFMCIISWLVVLIICDALLLGNCLCENCNYTYALEIRLRLTYFLSPCVESGVEFGLFPFLNLEVVNLKFGGVKG